MRLLWLFIYLTTTLWTFCESSNIIMITLGGTKSHKIIFMSFAKVLLARNHSVTLLSSFPAEEKIRGLTEITSPSLKASAENCNNVNIVESRMNNKDPSPPGIVYEYVVSSCSAFLNSEEFQPVFENQDKYDLIILDGAFSECTVASVHILKAPFIIINSVPLNVVPMAIAGAPIPYATSPQLQFSYTDTMTFTERTVNTFGHMYLNFFHWFFSKFCLIPMIKERFGDDGTDYYSLAKEVSLIIQYGHHSLTYPRPLMPNMVESGCLHCSPAKPLRKELEDFINKGNNGFILFSFGSSVKASLMPEKLRKILITAFSRLPYQILWKWEDDPREMKDLPSNVMLNKWLPQQDLLGHSKIRGFISHTGFLSIFETVYHGVPIVAMPVYCDQYANTAKAVQDGYAVALELKDVTSEKLVKAVKTIVENPKYKRNVMKRRAILKDSIKSPEDIVAYWIEYVLRHKGAEHLKTPARDMGFLEFYSLDVISVISVGFLIIFYIIFRVLKMCCGSKKQKKD